MKNESVYITKAAVYFPNNPVGNDEMEQYLGMIAGKPSLARRVVLSKNGIKNRYYALDKDGKATHSNAQICANAIRKLFDSQLSIDDIDLLACGTASPDQIMPSHAIMVHGELGGKKNIEAVSYAGSCCTGMQALKYTHMSLMMGSTTNAICAASERLSSWMTARSFEKETENLEQLHKRPMLAFEKEFLRWMLSDGGAALLLQKEPSKQGLSFRIDWIELTSFANQEETCMYAGSDKLEDGTLVGWTMFSEEEWLTKSIFSLKQDTRILGEKIVPLGGQFLMELVNKRGFTPNDVDWFLPHLSSMFFKDLIMEELQKIGFPISEEKWFFNLPKVGNVASASAFIMLEELMNSGRLKKGQKLLLMIPESARFSYAYCMLTVC